MARSKIEWLARPGTVPVSWNPVTGCTKISEGCAHCWAKRMSKRLAGRFGYPGDDPFAVTLHPDRLDEPLKWRKPRTVFVCSMGDLFHEDVPFDYIGRMWEKMCISYTHTFMLLTKRPDRMLAFLSSYSLPWGQVDARSNIWLGVTIENQKHYDRIEHLRACPAAVRFVSAEPLLGPLEFDRVDLSYRAIPGVAWVIVGGETGPGARTMSPVWARDVKYQCYQAGVPFFMKQMSKKESIPDDLMVREWPDD